MHQVEIATTQETLLDSPEMVLNMGPQHPSTHGVLRVILRLDGETVIDLDCDIGFLHRGMEKIAENRLYPMIAPYWDRLDYIAAVSNGLVWVETVEQMMGLEVPPRAHYIRTILTELNRISSHLLWLATHGLDIGAFTVLLWALREREEILKIFEQQFGARLTCHAWRIGGMPNDAYDGFVKDVQQFVDNFPKRIDEYETLLSENRIWLGRTVGIGVISAEDAIAIGLSGPALRGSGVAWDIRKARPYAAYADMDFDIPVGENGDTYDRYLVRLEEMRQSRRIVQQALRQAAGRPRQREGAEDHQAARRRLLPFHRRAEGRDRLLSRLGRHGRLPRPRPPAVPHQLAGAPADVHRPPRRGRRRHHRHARHRARGD